MDNYRKNTNVDMTVWTLLEERHAYQRLALFGWWVLAGFAAMLNIGVIRYFLRELSLLWGG